MEPRRGNFASHSAGTLENPPYSSNNQAYTDQEHVFWLVTICKRISVGGEGNLFNEKHQELKRSSLSISFMYSSLFSVK
jgi:hypothetical protein